MIMNEEIYYGCQIKVPRFGEEGQDLLQKSSCAIIGMGGLGCPVAQYLVPSGVGKVGLYDNDIIDESNINRQILYNYSEIGQKKVEVATKKLRKQNPFILIETKDMRINEGNWKDELSQYDIIIDCTDNFLSKFLIHDACFLLKKKLVQAGIFQTSGQVLYFDFGLNFEKAHSDWEKGCYRCLWEESPKLDKQASCEMAGVLSLVAGNVGLMQANIALLSLLDKANANESHMHLLDWEQLEWNKIRIPQKAPCMCNSEDLRKNIVSYLSEIPLECKELPQDKESFVILDLRNEEDHHKNTAFEDMNVFPVMQELRSDTPHFVKMLDKDTQYIAVCYRGIRSLDVTKKLREHGAKNVQSLVGGYTKLAQ